MKFERINTLRNDSSNDYSEHELCRILQVSRSAYRAFAKAPEKRPSLRENQILATMKAINSNKDTKCYGSPRMAKELRAQGYQISENTTAKLMRKHEIRARRKWAYTPPKTTTPDPKAKSMKVVCFRNIFLNFWVVSLV